MAGKPVHKRNDVNCREGVWKTMRKLKRFTLKEIWLETNMDRSSIADFISGLLKAGYLEVAKIEDNGKRFDTRVYDLVKGPREVPRIKKDGTVHTQGLARLQVWRTIKVLKVFNARDLVVNAATEEVPVKEVDVKHYLRYLHKAGYLRIIKKGEGTGNGGFLTLYKLIPGKHTGPKAPMIQHVKHVFDPNLGVVVWKPERPEASGQASSPKGYAVPGKAEVKS